MLELGSSSCVWRSCGRSQFVDLRGFPVSDEFISDRKTFCTILDRKEIFEISNNGFFISGHVTPEEMEMSEIILRIEWKHFRIPAGPASGRHCPLKSRNLGFGHLGTFVQSFWKFEKSTTAWPCLASARCLRWRPLVNAPPPFGLRRVLEGDCCMQGDSAARRRLRLILLCSRRYLEGQRISYVPRRPFIK